MTPHRTLRCLASSPSRRRNIGAIVLGCAVAAASGAGVGLCASQGNRSAAAIDVEAVGPQVGEVLPDFNLPDQRGALHALRSILGPQGAVIVFFRSADW